MQNRLAANRAVYRDVVDIDLSWSAKRVEQLLKRVLDYILGDV